MKKILESYQRFILNPTPPTWWLYIRAVLHWVTLPLKLLIIGGLNWAMRCYMFTWKEREIKTVLTKEREKRALPYLNVYQKLPIFRGENIELYASRVPREALPDGENHNTDHQGGRHGTYTFLMSRLGLRNSKMDEGLRLHMRGNHGFIRGFKKDKYITNGMNINASSVAGDQILGICLGMLDTKRSNPLEENSFAAQDALIENFELAVDSLIENDYANLDSDPKDDVAKKEYEKQLEQKKAEELVKIKSSRAMWQPGLETVGAQAITILAILKTSWKKCGSSNAKKHYKKLMWQFGYGLLSFYPTAFIPSKRGYFNDHNCLVAAYILAKLSDKGTWERWFWEKVAMNIWKLSVKYYNGYFTGLIRDLNPKLIPMDHVVKCLKYAFEEEPLLYSQEYSRVINDRPKEYPVKYNQMNAGGEFHPEKDHKIIEMDGPKHRNGLGWFAHVTMLDPAEAKKYMGRQ